MNKREERLRRLAEGAQNRVSSQLGDIWWAFMLRGVFAGVLGICAHLANSWFHDPDALGRSLFARGRSARINGSVTGSRSSAESNDHALDRVARAATFH